MKKLILISLISLVTFACTSSSTNIIKSESIATANNEQRKIASVDYCPLFVSNQHYALFTERMILDADTHEWRGYNGSGKKIIFKIHYLESFKILLEDTNGKPFIYIFDENESRYFDPKDRNEWIKFECPSLSKLRALYKNTAHDFSDYVTFTISTQEGAGYIQLDFTNEFPWRKFQKDPNNYLYWIRNEFKNEITKK